MDSTLWWVRYDHEMGRKTSVMVTSNLPVDPYPFADLPGVMAGEGNMQIWFEVINIFLHFFLVNFTLL